MDDSYVALALTLVASSVSSSASRPGAAASASGTIAWMVPTRTHESAGMSPSHHHWWLPPGQVRVAVTSALSTGWRRSLTAWTSSTRDAPGSYEAAGRSAVMITGAQAAARASYPAFGARSWSSTDHVTDGWPSPN